MYCQMGNDHGKGNKSGEKKKKKHSDSSNPQGIENGDLMQAEEGERLFSEERARRKDLAKDLKGKLNIKSKEPVPDSEREEPRSQDGSGSLSSNHSRNKHQNSVTQSNHSNVNDNHTLQGRGEQNGLLSDPQALNHLPPSTTHLPGSKTDGVHVDAAPSGPSARVNDVSMPVNEPDSVTNDDPERVLQEVPNNAPPGGPSQTMNGSLLVHQPEPPSFDAAETVPQEVPSNAQPSRPNQTANCSLLVHQHESPSLDAAETVPQEVPNNAQPSRPSQKVNGSSAVNEPGLQAIDAPDGVPQEHPSNAPPRRPNGALNDPLLLSNHGRDSNRSQEGGPSGNQSRASNPAIAIPDRKIGQPTVKVPSTGDDLSQKEKESSKKVEPQEQNEYSSCVASNQPTSLTPQSKVESSTPSGMQIVPGITNKSGVNEEGAEKLKVADQLISKAVTDNVLLLEKLSKHLDREGRVIKCWKHLAYVLNVPAEETRKFDMYTEHSPTEDLFNYLGDIWRPDLTVKELKVKLKAVYRNDVIDSLNKGGFRDEMNVGNLMSGQPRFIALLSTKLDMESRTIGNWRSLATQFGIRKQKTEQFGLRGSGPTGALFSHMRTTEGLRDLTVGQLRGHFRAMERNDLVNILEKHNCQDSHQVRKVAVDGSELLADVGERLNKDMRAVKNWRNLAYRLKIPHEVYDAFDTSKGAAKSPTKMLFEWLANWKPNLSVGDLLSGLKQIDRYDVVELVTKETAAALENNKEDEAHSRQKCEDYTDSIPHQSAAKQAFSNLQQMHRDTDKLSKETDLPLGLEKNATAKGFVISHNPGEGNCMFHALSEQLELQKRISISHNDLRRNLVQYLKEHAKLPDGTSLFNFVDGHPSWTDYLENMGKDGTWGDHVILIAAANCYKCVIRVISSLPGRHEVIITPDPPVCDTVQLVVGHIHEEHYVSLRPFVSAYNGLAGSRGNFQIPANVDNYQHLQGPRYGELPQPAPPCTMYSHVTEPQGHHEVQRHQRTQAYQQLPVSQQPEGQKQRYARSDRNSLPVRNLPYKVYNKICIKLNIRRDWFDDFRMVAEALGMDRDTINYVEQDRNPADRIFNFYYPKVSVRELIEILHKIERMDVAAVLETELIPEA